MNKAFMNTTFIRTLEILAVSIIGMVSSYFYALPILMFFSSLFLFGCYDVLGFYFLLTREGGIPSDPKSRTNAAYRIIQTLFQIQLGVLLYFLGGLYVSLAFVLGWWVGGADLIYYLCTWQKYWTWGPVYWTWWTPWGLLKRIFGKYLSPEEFTLQAILGVLGILSGLIYFLYYF